MRKMILVLLIYLMNYTIASATKWITSFEDAQKIAIAENKLILIDFWADWSTNSMLMDCYVWDDDEVKDLMKNFIPLRIDVDNNNILVSRYSINRVPYLFIVDPVGEIIYKDLEEKNKSQVIKILKEYSVNTSFLQVDFLSYRKSKSSKSAMNIAEKYSNYLVFVNKPAQKDFFRVAKRYLKKVKRISDKKDYKQKYSQKANLLSSPYRNLVNGKYEKVIKVLNKKFKENEISEANKGLYNFLYFASYSKLKDKEKAKLWYEKLKKDKDAKLYLLKLRKV